MKMTIVSSCDQGPDIENKVVKKLGNTCIYSYISYGRSLIAVE
jgi:hypothetical protein